MKVSDNKIVALAQAQLGRRSFMRSAGMLGLGAAAAGIVLVDPTPRAGR